MKNLNKPNFTAETVFLKCISTVSSPDLKSRLTACKNLINEAELEFDNKANSNNLHTILRERIINENVTSKELETVYTYRMVNKKMPGRIFYDKLFLAPPQGTCPICSCRKVSNLDHYLPKVDYPRLATTPINLVPLCSDCNKIKFTNKPISPEDETFHPYFDDIDNDVWLAAEVIQSTPPSIKFKVEPPDNWTALLKRRIHNHFVTFCLDELYSVEAAGQLVDIYHGLNLIFQNSGASGVKSYLIAEYLSRFHAKKNSWQTAMYKTIASSTWFCNEGFKLLKSI